MEVFPVCPDDIVVGDRHRPVDAQACKRLAASMEANGLQQPITIRVVDLMVIDGQEVEGVPVLVAGHHRLEAAKGLGWDQIDCVEIDDDPVVAEMVELAENLHRLDLTKEQRDQHIRRYAELLGTRRNSGSLCSTIPASRSPGMPKGIARQISDETGLSKSTVQRALNPPPPPEPRAPLPEYDVVTVQYNALMGAWNRAGKEAREMFVGEIDASVMDAKFGARAA